ncbi:hypothetical protein [Azospirillum argentinense]|uniref:Uncharacterized protein n=1 Tax=Azospirillum argentinense TaxID=2970906 RepID=A0A5B0KWS5_9PROT|nr:hypothetical protein [Azospirillum argentinense]KAA1057187.1 hypothetical protein FH063_001355 [Azospirillum argentinense]
MNDAPSRSEIDAKLEAAEARTETRFVQLQGDMDRRFTEMRAEMDQRFSGVERRIDKLVDAAEGWAKEMRETRQTVVSENKSTRLNLWIVAVSSVIAVGLGLYSIHSLSIATQANMIAIFQAGQATPKQ